MAVDGTWGNLGTQRVWLRCDMSQMSSGRILRDAEPNRDLSQWQFCPKRLLDFFALQVSAY